MKSHRHHLAISLACAALLGLALGAGCKKKKDPPKKPAAPAGDMQQDLKGKIDPGAMPAPVKRAKTPGPMNAVTPAPAPLAAPAGKAGALPIPFNMPVLHANLKALRSTPMFKKWEPKAREIFTGFLKDNPVGKALVTTCKLDPIKQLDEITISVKLGRVSRGDAIGVIKGSFDAAKLIGCAEKVLKANKALKFKPATLGKAKGVEVTFNGIQFLVVALGPNTILAAGGNLKDDAIAVHNGKKGSVAETKLFKELWAKKTAETVLIGVVPVIKLGSVNLGGMGGMMGMMVGSLLRRLRSGAITAGIPGGGFSMSVTLNTNRAGTAASLSSLLSRVVSGVASSGKLPKLAKLTKKLKISSDGPKLLVSVKLTKDELKEAVDAVSGLGDKIRSMFNMGKMLRP